MYVGAAAPPSHGIGSSGQDSVWLQPFGRTRAPAESPPSGVAASAAHTLRATARHSPSATRYNRRASHDAAGRGGTTAHSADPETLNVSELVRTGYDGSTLTWVIGLRRRAPFGVAVVNDGNAESGITVGVAR